MNRRRAGLAFFSWRQVVYRNAELVAWRIGCELLGGFLVLTTAANRVGRTYQGIGGSTIPTEGSRSPLMLKERNELVLIQRQPF
jgi:hypothetical protein